MFNNATTMFVFPGQGSQSIGMGKEFYECGSTRSVFEEADDVLSQHLTKLMLEGDSNELTLTSNTQPALLIASYAAWVYLQKQTGQNISDMAKFAAGHSLGEYSALTASGSFDFAIALKLVRTRGEAMQEAVPAGEGSMAAILGLSIDIVTNIASEAGCWVANDNSDGQVVVSGSTADVDKVIELAKANGAKRALKLGVSAPFHCPLMQPAAEVMDEALNANMPTDSAVPIITNVEATSESNGSKLKTTLVSQVTGQVKWRESIIYAAESGITSLYELGSGKVLTGLAKRCDSRLKATSLNTPENIDNLLENLEKESAA